MKHMLVQICNVPLPPPQPPSVAFHEMPDLPCQHLRQKEQYAGIAVALLKRLCTHVDQFWSQFMNQEEA